MTITFNKILYQKRLSLYSGKNLVDGQFFKQNGKKITHKKVLIVCEKNDLPLFLPNYKKAKKITETMIFPKTNIQTVFYQWVTKYS
jgi:hypothetical protein